MTDSLAINPERGEVGITLDGKVYPMRPSYEAMLAIETAVGPILSVSMRLRDPLKMLSVNEIAVIVTECVKAAGADREDTLLSAFKTETVARLIFAEGVHTVVHVLTPLMFNMLTGGGESKKNSAVRKSTKAKASTTAE